MKIHVIYMENSFDEGITLIKAYKDYDVAFDAFKEFLDNNNVTASLETVELE